MANQARKHLSYSGWKTFQECPYKYKLHYIEKKKTIEPNIHLAFGTACHAANQKKVFDETVDEKKIFVDSFRKELKKIPREIFSKYSKEEVLSFKDQGEKLCSLTIPCLKSTFPDYKVISAEDKINEPIKDFLWDFLGFIDLVIQSEDKIKIIDWKTCSWGWDARKKANKLFAYQLIFYKMFFAQKYNIDLNDIDVCFILMKRTAKNNEVEPVLITSGNKRVENAKKSLFDTTLLINQGTFPKNHVSCAECDCKEYCNKF